MRRTKIWGLLLGLAVVVPAMLARAGGGPENVLLVVNFNSADSLTIANHYCALRPIPPECVLTIPYTGDLDTVDGVVFRDQILRPILSAIDERKLSAQIDYVVYSCDFPWRVQLKPVLTKVEFAKDWMGFASLTGCTYLFPYVMEGNPAILMPWVNYYVPECDGATALTACQRLAGADSQAFRSRYLWDKKAKRVADPKLGQRYLVSAMLAVTRGRGTTVDQAKEYLRRAAQADGTQPDGTFYFAKNPTVRSTPRHNCFAEAMKGIFAAGGHAQLIDAKVPLQRDDVMGLMAGVPDVSVEGSNLKILPGAFCEHLTSYAGVFDQPWQTCLSEYLKHGAAGSCGTVAEPYAVQWKFPLPSLHVHYRRGCSLGESFYQSVAGPYQTLLVGDPLCQPWAKPPQASADGLASGAKLSKMAVFTPQSSDKSEQAACELLIDGRLVARIKPGTAVPLDTTTLANGEHEIRVVAVAGNSIESSGRVRYAVTVENGAEPAEPVKVTTAGGALVPVGGKATLRATGPAAAFPVEVLHFDRVVATLANGEESAELDAATLGRGQVVLRVRDARGQWAKRLGLVVE